MFRTFKRVFLKVEVIFMYFSSILEGNCTHKIY